MTVNPIPLSAFIVLKLQVKRRTTFAFVKHLLNCLHQQFASHFFVSFFEHFRLSEKFIKKPIELVCEQLNRGQVRRGVLQLFDGNAGYL